MPAQFRSPAHVFSTLALCFACRDATGPEGVPPEFGETRDPLVVFEATSQQLSPWLRGAPARFESRDTTVVRVSTTGVVTGVLTGTTYIVATSDSGRDSLPVAVVLARVQRPGVPFGAAISPQGVAYVTLAYGQQLSRADLPDTSFATTVDVGWIPSDVEFNASGTLAYVTNQYSGSVAVVDVAAGQWVDTIPIPGDPFRVMMSPGGEILWVTSNVDSLYAVRLPDGEIVARLAAPAAPNGLAARDELVWVSGRDQPFILELNARTYEVVRTLTVGGRPQELVLSPDGTLLYIANEAGYVQVWDLAANAELRRVDLPGGGGFAMAQNPTNGRLYVSTGYFSRSVWVINPENGHIARHILTGGTPRRIAFTARGLGIVPNEWGWVDFIR
jgi:YVTN family beta-propeller protein